MTKTETKSCTECNLPFTLEVMEFNGRPIMGFSICEQCIEKRQSASEQAIKQCQQNAREKSFWEEVPPLYRDTDKSRLNAILVAAIDAYQYGPKGLGMIGLSGAGKTRAAILLLHRIHLQLGSSMYLKATTLTKHAADQFSDDYPTKNSALARIKLAYRVNTLMLDDIGKGRLTPTAEELLFDIIDQRTERMKPIIWTSNMNASGLQKAFSDDRANPLLRRLSEFTKIISI